MLTKDQLRVIFHGADTTDNRVIEFSKFLEFLYGISPSNGGGGSTGA